MRPSIEGMVEDALAADSPVGESIPPSPASAPGQRRDGIARQTPAAPVDFVQIFAEYIERVERVITKSWRSCGETHRPVGRSSGPVVGEFRSTCRDTSWRGPAVTLQQRLLELVDLRHVQIAVHCAGAGQEIAGRAMAPFPMEQ